MNCPKCNKMMNLIPAGFSKRTGKPYQAFYGCSDRDCKGTAQVATPEKKFEAELDADTQQKKIEKAVAEKRANINWLNAKTNAVNLIMNHKIFAKLEAPELKKAIEKWTEWFNELETPSDLETELKAEKKRNEANAELEEIGDSVDSEETPF